MGKPTAFHKYIAPIFLLALIWVTAAGGNAMAATIAAPQLKAETPLREEISYKIYWNGIRAGKLWLYWEEDATRYAARMQLKTSGLVRIFSKQLRTASAEGTKQCDTNGCTYTPVKAGWDVQYRHKSRKVELEYGPKGTMTSATVTPTDNRATRPDVDQKDKDRSLDALSATQRLFFGMLRGEKNIVIPVYDGRRFTEFLFDFADKERMLYAAARKPISGYTAKELKEVSEGDPPILLQVVPNRRFPIAALAKTSFGALKITESK